MILADTSVWIRHFRIGFQKFEDALRKCTVATHPVVIGELATGDLTRRTTTLAMLHQLPNATAGRADECLEFIETHKLYGRGIGWGDVQLLVAAKLSGFPLWSLDSRLDAAAAHLGVAFIAP